MAFQGEKFHDTLGPAKAVPYTFFPQVEEMSPAHAAATRSRDTTGLEICLVGLSGH
jgi:hypothetical protein